MELQEARKLAYKLMKEHRLPSYWWFEFDSARRRFGRCSMGHKRITLSKHLTKLNDLPEVKDVILHEIAHALDYEDRGTSDHGPKWKAMARKVGANPERYYDSEKVKNIYRVFDYCPACGFRRGKHRRSLRRRLASCHKCSEKFDPDYLIVTNIPRKKMEAVDVGRIDWQELPQALDEIELLKRDYPSSYQQLKFYQRYLNHRVEAAANNPAPSSSVPSNKEVIYQAWSDGQKDIDALHALVDEAVKRSTVRAWTNKWKRGKGLPASAR